MRQTLAKAAISLTARAVVREKTADFFEIECGGKSEAGGGITVARADTAVIVTKTVWPDGISGGTEGARVDSNSTLDGPKNAVFAGFSGVLKRVTGATALTHNQ